MLVMKAIHFSLAQLRGMAEHLQRATRIHSLDIVFVSGERQVPAVPWQHMAWPADGQTWLIELIWKCPECRKRLEGMQTANEMGHFLWLFEGDRQFSRIGIERNDRVLVLNAAPLP